MQSLPNLLKHLILPEVRAKAIKKTPKSAFGTCFPFTSEERDAFSQNFISELRRVTELDKIYEAPLSSFILKITTREELNAYAQHNFERLGFHWLNPSSLNTVVVALPKSKLEGLHKILGEYGKTGSRKTYLDQIAKIEAIPETEKISTEVFSTEDEAAHKFDIDFYSGLSLEDYEAAADYARKTAGSSNIIYRKTDDPEMPFIRINATREIIKKVAANLSAVKQIRLVPPITSTTTLPNKVVDVTFEPADDDLRTVMVIDCGVNHEHPAIANVLIMKKGYLRDQSTADVSEGNEAGHGTKVAGFAAYGPMPSLHPTKLKPTSKISIAKIHEYKDETPPESLLEKVVEDGIAKGIRVYSLTILYERPANTISRLAYELDRLSKKYDVLFIVSAGNIPGSILEGFQREGLIYPAYFTRQESRIYEGSEACCVLTIGGLAHTDSHDSIAKRMQASPFTRCGPTVDGRLKPELVHFAGNLTKTFESSTDLSLLSLNHEYETSYYCSDIGTSFSAPIVANMASQIVKEYPKATANLLRALLIHSAKIPEESINVNEPRYVYGFGFPDLRRAVYSTSFSPTIVFEGALTPDEYIDVAIPLPKELKSSKGSKFMQITLTYDPPVSLQNQALNYPLLDLSFTIWRKNKNGKLVRVNGTDKSWQTPYYRQPLSNTVKRDIFQWERGHTGEDWIIRIMPLPRSEKSKMPKQRFALVVSIEDSVKKTDFYSPIATIFDVERQKAVSVIPIARPQKQHK